YDQANALESALRQSEEFQNMKEFYGKVNENPESKALFDEFREIQMNLQQKQMQGEEIQEEEVQKAQKSAEDIEKDEKIKSKKEADQKKSNLIHDHNIVIMNLIEDINE